MNFFETVNRRGSYRDAFDPAPIPLETLQKMLDAAIKAPSGLNLQSTSFIVVTDPELRKQISDLMPSDATRTAPVIIVVVSEKIESEGLSFEMQDYAAATENLLLAITAMGYAAVWMDGQTGSDGFDKKIAAMLQVPAGKTVRTIIPLGKPLKPVQTHPRKPLEERVTFK